MNDVSFIYQKEDFFMAYTKSQKIGLHKDERRKLILKTAAAIFAKKGYHQTVVKDITDSAEISVGTFYLYFKNKEDLFEKLYDETWRNLCNLNDYALKADNCTAAKKFSRAIASSIWGYQKFKDLTKIMMIEAVGLNPRFEEKYAHLMRQSVSDIANILEPLKERGLIAVSDIKVAATAYIGGIHNVITCWLRDGACSDLCESTLPLVVFLMQGLNMDFNVNELKQSIDEMNEELENNYDQLEIFKN
jgi:AcrR family transcriptional regulator